MLPDRIDQKIMKVEDGCWLWNGGLSIRGYGRCWHQNKPRRAHIVVYEMLVGDVPEGLELHHACEVTACVNPQHLEAVTHVENVRASLSCKVHSDWGDKVRSDGRVSRECRTCAAQRQRQYRRNEKEEQR